MVANMVAKLLLKKNLYRFNNAEDLLYRIAPGKVINYSFDIITIVPTFHSSNFNENYQSRFVKYEFLCRKFVPQLKEKHFQKAEKAHELSRN